MGNAKIEFKGEYADLILALRNVTGFDVTDYKEQKELRGAIVAKGMDVELKEFLERPNLVIYGDYDADGITSTASALRVVPWADYVCPERNDGYGLNEFYLNNLEGSNILTVDCGVRSADLIKKYEGRIDFFVTDHHLPEGEIPPKTINPKVYSKFFDGYSGSGVVLKSVGEVAGDYYDSLVDLAAIGTVADVVPMRGENRRIVRDGIRRLARSRPAWLMEMAGVYGININYLDEDHIAYYIAPAINAAGRMGSPSVAVEMLSAVNPDEAVEKARTLVKLNALRKKKTAELVRQYKLASDGDRINFKNYSVFFSEERNNGLIGLLAGKIASSENTLAIVLCDNQDGTYTASARSGNAYTCNYLLKEIEPIIVSGGGHEKAAGFTMEKKWRDNFMERIEFLDHVLSYEEESLPDIEIDFFTAMSLLDEIEDMGPYGHEFEKPVFLSTVRIDERYVDGGGMASKGHFSGSISGYRAIGFGQRHKFAGTGRYVLEYTVKRDTYRGANEPMAMIEDIKKV